MSNSKKLQFKKICVVIAVMFAMFFCNGCKFSFAWWTSGGQDDDNVVIGNVGVEVYSNGNLIASGTSDSRTNYTNNSIIVGNQVNGAGTGLIAFKNTGNVDCLLMVEFVAGIVNTDIYEEGAVTGEDLDSMTTSDMNITWGGASNVWVKRAQFSPDNYIGNGDFFYNDTIASNETITFVSNYTVTNSLMAGQKLVFAIRVNVISYDGNPYKNSADEKPFGDISTIQGWTAYQ